jgi:hypothetical protein
MLLATKAKTVTNTFSNKIITQAMKQYNNTQETSPTTYHVTATQFFSWTL